MKTALLAINKAKKCGERMKCSFLL